MAGGTETETLVPVFHRRDIGAVEESENGVVRGSYDNVLDIRQFEIVVRLEDGASRHERIEDDHRVLVVIDRPYLVASGRSEEIQIGGGAVEHAAELRRSAAFVDAERVVYLDAAAGCSAR